MTAPPDPLIGRTLEGRYRVDELIGSGGMGAVYRGRHLMMDGDVALKVLRPDRASDEAARRFSREARSTFRLDHPHCVRVTDFGATDDGLMYLVMEYLDGRTVGTELQVDGPVSAPRVAHIGRQVCEALHRAHDLGLIHRDLKPDNIMLLRRGADPDFVKVLDFGLARIFDGAGGAFTTALSVSPLTQQGTVFGTPEYMSPEQATGQPLDPRTDVYSLGVVLYEMLTGSLPFTASHPMAMLSMHVQTQPVPPAVRRPDLAVPERLDALVMQCLGKSPDQRPPSAQALAEALGELDSAAARAPSRLPRQVAASATVDLGAEEIAEAGAPRGAAATDSALTGATDRRRWSRSRRAALIAVAATALAAGAVMLLLQSGGDPGAGGPGAAIPEPAEPAVAAADAAPSGIDASVAASSVADASPDAARPDPAETRRRRDRRSGTESRDGSRRPSPAAAHLRAAEEARAAGNTLRQMAEADTALRLDRSSARAAFLLGDALVESGDVANGCRYLRRARSIPQARTRSRQADCEHAGSGD